MEQINWQQFGLKKDPYDTLALVEGGDLPIEKAFVGREVERQRLNNLFNSTDRLCVALCGNTGVGKTSLANFHKFFWKYQNKEKRLFSFRREIEASADILDKRNFLIEILGSALRELELLQPDLLRKELLQKIKSIVDISKESTLAGGLSGGAFDFNIGFEVGRERTRYQPIQLSLAILEQYFYSRIRFIKETESSGGK